jgi:RES domain-containing protein
VSYEVFSTAHHPGWHAEDCLGSKAYGAAWQRSKRSSLLIVPSVVARMENNVLINDSHPEVRRIATSLHQPIW